jgi:hypothetical protein
MPFRHRRRSVHRRPRRSNVAKRAAIAAIIDALLVQGISHVRVMRKALVGKLRGIGRGHDTAQLQALLVRYGYPIENMHVKPRPGSHTADVIAANAATTAAKEGAAKHTPHNWNFNNSTIKKQQQQAAAPTPPARNVPPPISGFKRIVTKG